MPRLRYILLPVLGFVLVGGVAACFVFDSDMKIARASLAGRSSLVDTAVGAIEYAETGEGRSLLTIHGAGGGFDQGLDNAAAMIGPGYRLISPSRFGYLRTPIPADASPPAQADAHLALLDKLGLGTVIVFGVSAGTRSALELALRHPERVAALILIVPATYYPDMVKLETQRAADFPLMLWLVNNGADFAWWALEHIAPDALVRFIGVPPEVMHEAAPADRTAVMNVVRSIEPLSERFAGINIDSQPDLVPRALAELKVPTLLVTARDDLFETYPAARYAALQIPNAKLIAFDHGGHLLVGHESEVRAAVMDFLAKLGLGPLDSRQSEALCFGDASPDASSAKTCPVK